MKIIWAYLSSTKIVQKKLKIFSKKLLTFLFFSVILTKLSRTKNKNRQQRTLTNKQQSNPENSSKQWAVPGWKAGSKLCLHKFAEWLTDRKGECPWRNKCEALMSSTANAKRTIQRKKPKQSKTEKLARCWFWTDELKQMKRVLRTLPHFRRVQALLLMWCIRQIHQNSCEHESDVLDSLNFILESLILAQDERWRRA